MRERTIYTKDLTVSDAMEYAAGCCTCTTTSCTTSCAAVAES
ncbi:listeriolysin S family TOMM bacteriocin [Lactobacillus crispatus]